MRRVIIVGIAFALIAGSAGSQTQPKTIQPVPGPPPRMTPKLEAVAETKLLMNGLTQPNFKGIERLLRQPPADLQSWTFGRGQALLIAETGNLLMLRPPKGQGQDAWFERAADLRAKATQLAKSLAAKDYNAGRAGFVELANSCNRCHQTFRVQVLVEPFVEPGKGP
jgi:hypothetical protein